MLRALLILAALATAAGAEPAGDQTIALALFAEGKELATHGDYAAACTKFEAAEHLTHWIGVELNLADCYEHVGRSASAWVLFLKVADQAERAHDKRASYARSRAVTLAPSLSRLVLTTHTTTTVELRIDDVAVDTDALGIALPLDPGEHVLEVSAPGHVPYTQRLSLVAGSTMTLEIPALELTPVVTAPPPRSYRRLARWLGGAGGLLAGTSLVLGIDAKLRYDAITHDHCDASLSCDDAGLAGIRAARQRGTVATITGIAGAAAITGAVVIYALSPREHAFMVTPIATPSAVGLALEGKL